ncbi:MAG: ABC transporter permease [Peptococcaceae bacterium]|nr:ABC transporter permease [Peptococcaceae bacterium]
MFKYFARRILISIMVLFIISIAFFFLIHLAPGDPIDAMYTNIPGMTQEQLDAKKAAIGLDKPIIVQYGIYIRNLVLRGDFGESIQFKRPVLDLIRERLWNTFALVFAAMAISMLLAVPIGVTSAVKKNSAFDYIFTSVAFVGLSIPSFFFGFLLIKLFAVDLQILPAAGVQTPGNMFTGAAMLADRLKHFVMPVSVLAFINMASYTRYVRSSISDVIKQDYIRTARSKGLVQRIVVYRHALRNGLIPIVTILGSSLATIFSGSLITENIFSWPGLGRLIYGAIMARDYFLLMGVNIFTAFLVLLGQLIADAMLVLVDPRIKYN